MKRLMYIGWPSFLMAGVIEMLVFAMVDPQDLRWFGGEAVGLSRSSVYSLSFFCFWLVTGLASALSLYLADPDDHVHPSSDARLI